MELDIQYHKRFTFYVIPLDGIYIFVQKLGIIRDLPSM